MHIDINTAEAAISARLIKRLRPLDERCGYKICPGIYRLFGAMPVPGGVNFTVHSRNATSCELCLFERKASEPFAVIPFPESYKIGNVFAMTVFGLDIEEFEYAYRLDGPYDPGNGFIFDKTKFLLDPYAKAVTGRSVWGEKPDGDCLYKARVVEDNFDWRDCPQPNIPFKDMIIYELHVRGYTRHPSSGVKNPGTFAGLQEKIPYLKELGVNAVELMPVFEFDEWQAARKHEGSTLLDYWGYNPIAFFAPNTSYTAGLEYNREGDELKTLISELHMNGMEVILDVVFNHTAEGNEHGPYISFKGFDNNIYYMLTPDGKYYNFSGCGNTLNCNHPIVQNIILDCLRYWVANYRIDGFRFDLASILGRNEDGTPMESPPILQSLAYDPILGKAKLIAEAWDAGGLYQVGSFPSWNRWSEWNGKYRDDLRRFLKGDGGLAWDAANRIAGSKDLYDPAYRGDSASVNFITCHDGFTLNDLYAYSRKHNEQNGWRNADGDNNNNSWNCGVEGETDDPEINRLRTRLKKNAAAILLVSHGAPMMRAGDEFGNTQYGNNNAYCQDNEISWQDWSLIEKNAGFFSFVKSMIAFRKAHPVLRNHGEAASCGLPLTSFHGRGPWFLETEYENRYVGVMFAGRTQDGCDDDIIYLAANMHWEEVFVSLPSIPAGLCWHTTVNTFNEKDSFVQSEDDMPEVTGGLTVPPRTVMILRALHHQ